MSNRSRVLDIILVLGFCLFLFAYGLGAFGLTGADEPRYAQIAREMLARHDWVTPVLYGQPWLEKPILYYWLAIISYKIFGVSDWAARVPSAALATLMVIGVYLFSLRMRRAIAGVPTTRVFPWWGGTRCRSDDSLLGAGAGNGARCFDRHAAYGPFRAWNALLVRVARMRPALAVTWLLLLHRPGNAGQGAGSAVSGRGDHHRLLSVGSQTSANRQDVMDPRRAVVSRGGSAVVR